MYTSDKDTIIIDSYEIIEEDLRSNKEARAKARSRSTSASGSRASGRLPQDFRTSLIYLAISAGLAFAGAIYEIFSHGVYSYFMIYAFAITLIGGALPYMLSYIGSLTGRFAQLRALLGSAGEGLYHAGIATLTVGSIMKGVLDIYGTTNRLTMVYPVIGAILIIAAVALAVRKNTLNINTEQPAV